MPTGVSFYSSADGRSFRLIGKTPARTRPEDKGVRIEDFSVPVSGQMRYLRVVGHNRGLCPPTHKGAGGKAWIFADEIRVE